MPHRQVRTTDPVDTAEQLIEQRAEERRPLVKVDKFFDRYGRIIVAVLLAVGGWFMRDVVEPLRYIPTLAAKQAAQDSTNKLILHKLDKAESDRYQMGDILAALAALQCEQSTPREKLTSKLCRKITVGVVEGDGI